MITFLLAFLSTPKMSFLTESHQMFVFFWYFKKIPNWVDVMNDDDKYGIKE